MLTDKHSAMDTLMRDMEYLARHHTRIGVLSGPAKGGNVQGTDAKQMPVASAGLLARVKANKKKQGIENLRVKFAREDFVEGRAKKIRAKAGGERARIRKAHKARKRRIDARSEKRMGNASNRLSMARTALKWTGDSSKSEAKTKASLDVSRREMASELNAVRRKANAKIKAKRFRTSLPRSGAGGPNLTVAEVFSFHENGLRSTLGPGHNHRRSSIAWVADNKKTDIRAFLVEVTELVVAGKMSGKEALFFAGEKGQSLVKARIVSGIPPALNPDYLEYKSHAGGKATPLIWTGQLLNSVRYQVNKGL